jgi:hypothetical protein
MIDLKPFCAKDREEIQKPWSHGGYTWATNGHIIIRVPENKDIPDNPKAPDGMKVWPKEPEEYFDIPAIPPVKYDPCQWCGEYEGVCEECYGEARFERREGIRIGPTLYSSIYLRMIENFPEIKFGPHIIKPGDRRPSAAIFKFKGGEGLLMPCFE